MNVRKRLGALLLAVCVSVSLLCVPARAAGEQTIRISSASAQAGGTVRISISLENNPGIIAMLLKVEYNNSVFTLTDVQDAGLLGEGCHNPDLDKCPYILSWADDSAKQNCTVNGTIVTLTFQVKEGAEAGTYPVTVSYDNEEEDHIIDVDLETVDFQIAEGYVTVTSGEAEDENSGSMGEGVTWSYDRTAKTLDVKGSIPSGQAVYVASYDENGKMLDLTIILGEQLGISPALEACRLKLFLIGASMNPACASVEVLTR